MSNGTSKHPYSVYEEFGHGYPLPEVAEHRIHRYEYRYIESWIEEKSKVLDLGCGSGSLGESMLIVDFSLPGCGDDTHNIDSIEEKGR